MSEYLDNMNTENPQDEGKINYANSVISTIVSVATTEVEGISGIYGSGRNKVPRGVKVVVNGEAVRVDISVTVDYGMPIQKVGRNCQENVRKSIESMTGLHVEKVDIHVIGVSFEKENKEMQKSQKLAMSLETEEEQQAAHQDEQDEEVKVEYSEESSTDPDMYADEPVNDESRDPESGNSEVPAEE